jgi:predicted DNA-binding protein
VPNQPATQGHSIRIPDELWEQILRIAKDRGETATDVILRAIRQHVRNYPS